MKVIPQNNEQEKAVKSLPAIDAIRLNVGEEQAIDIAESVWICASGKLDCYIVDHRDSHNKKYYLTDFTVKQCLTLTQSTEYSFYVIAREPSELQVLRYRDLVEVGAETFFCTYTDVWLEAVICQLARRHTAEAQDDSHAYYDNWQKMESSQFIFSRKRMSWCGILKPSHYLGYELESSIDRILLPITLRNGLASDIAQYIQLKTTRELEKENRLLPAFDQFYLLLIDEIFAAKDLEKNTDEEALAGSVEKENEKVTKTFKNFLSVVKYGHHAPIIEPHVNPLLGACEHLIQSLGQKFIEPKQPLETEEWVPTVEEICQASNVRVRQIKLPKQWWQLDLGSLLVFDQETHKPFAVVKRWRSGYDVFDPEKGEKLGKAEEDFYQQLEDKAFCLYPPFEDKPQQISSVVKFGLGLAQRDIIALVALTLFSILVTLAPPMASGYIFNSVVPNYSYNLLFQIGMALGVTYSALFVVNFAAETAKLRIAGKLSTFLFAALFDRVMRLPEYSFKKFQPADLLLRITGVEDLRTMLSGFVVTAMVSGVSMIAVAVVLSVYSPRAALIAIAVMLVFIVISSIIGYRAYRAFYEGEKMTANLIAMIYEMIDSIVPIRITASENRAFIRWGHNFTAMRTKLIGSDRMANLHKAVSEGYEVITLVAVLAALALLQKEDISQGAFVAFASLLGMFLQHSRMLGKTIMEVFKSWPLVKRVTPLMEAQPESNTIKTKLSVLKGHLDVKNISYSYSLDMPPILDACSFSVAPGQLIAIVGRSGSGKSTLLKMLAGLIMPLQGAIYYDQIDIRRLDLNFARKRLGVLLQGTHTFPGSIYENITAVSDITLKDAWTAADQAGLAEVIERLPMSMHTIITDKNASLSTGEVQRLLLARAFASKPDILLLDEPVTTLDAGVKGKIVNHLINMPATRIIVTHDLELVTQCDNILVMDSGRVVESGCYETLLQKKGVFNQFVNSQIVQ